MTRQPATNMTTYNPVTLLGPDRYAGLPVGERQRLVWFALRCVRARIAVDQAQQRLTWIMMPSVLVLILVAVGWCNTPWFALMVAPIVVLIPFWFLATLEFEIRCRIEFYRAINRARRL